MKQLINLGLAKTNKVYKTRYRGIILVSPFPRLGGLVSANITLLLAGEFFKHNKKKKCFIKVITYNPVLFIIISKEIQIKV
jgi:hypothetical protein